MPAMTQICILLSIFKYVFYYQFLIVKSVKKKNTILMSCTPHSGMSLNKSICK